MKLKSTLSLSHSVTHSPIHPTPRPSHSHSHSHSIFLRVCVCVLFFYAFGNKKNGKVCCTSSSSSSSSSYCASLALTGAEGLCDCRRNSRVPLLPPLLRSHPFHFLTRPFNMTLYYFLLECVMSFSLFPLTKRWNAMRVERERERSTFSVCVLLRSFGPFVECCRVTFPHLTFFFLLFSSSSSYLETYFLEQFHSLSVSMLPH